MQNATRIGAILIAMSGAISSAAPAAAREASGTAGEPITSPAGGERVGAGLVTIDVTGIPSTDLLRSPNNTVLFIWIGPFNYVTGFGYDVVLQTILPGSRRRDISMFVRDTQNLDFTGFFIQPGAIDPTPGGPTAYSSEGVRKLDTYNIPPVQALADGLIRLEFFEARDDAAGETDALWSSGGVSLQTAFEIPSIVSPGAFGMFTVAGSVCIRRGRRRASPHSD